MKENKCCCVEVSETKKGLCFEVTGARLKECLSSWMSCCAPKKDGAKPSAK